MLARRFRLFGVVGVLTLLVLYLARNHRQGYSDLDFSEVKIPSGWLHKDENGSWGTDAKPEPESDSTSESQTNLAHATTDTSDGTSDEAASTTSIVASASAASTDASTGTSISTSKITGTSVSAAAVSSKKKNDNTPTSTRIHRWGVHPSDIPAIEEAERLEKENAEKEAAAKAAKEKAKEKAKQPVPPSQLKGNNNGLAVDVDWKKFAYAQYATDSEYLCNALLMFEALYRLGALAERVLMYPSYMLPDTAAKTSKSTDGRLIIKAREEYDVRLAPIELLHRDNGEDDTWTDSYTKLLAFNQTQYKRVLHLDADGWILSPMDELFLLPEAPVAMPRAYWLLHDEPPKRVMSSQLMLIQPSAKEFARVKKQVESVPEGTFDMEIVNDLYLDSAMILPHRKYNLLTAEFRSHSHAAYLGSDTEEWDPLQVYNEAKFVHFSDWPVPKPWVPMEDETRTSMQPACRTKEGTEDCTERKLWNSFYNDYLKSRDSVCFGSD